MTTRNAVAACVMLALARTPVQLTPVQLTNDQRAVIAAALAHDFPDRVKPLVVSKYLADARWKPRVARSDTRSGSTRSRLRVR